MEKQDTGEAKKDQTSATMLPSSSSWKSRLMFGTTPVEDDMDTDQSGDNEFHSPLQPAVDDSEEDNADKLPVP